MRIDLPERFNFAATVVSHGWYLLAPFRWNAERLSLSRSELLPDGRVADLEITEKDGSLSVNANLSLERHRRTLLERFRRMFQLEVDLRQFHALCSRSLPHRFAASSGYGRLLCGSTLFEDAVKIITTTNTTWRQTMRMNELLVTVAGRSSANGNRAFPSPDDLASMSVERLRQDCRLGYRAVTIHRLASGIVDGSIELDRISDAAQSTEELFESYRSLPGIGPYGAAHLLAMDGRHDFIAVDTEFRRFVRERWFRGREVSDAEMLARYRRWGRWKYLAYWAELWSSIRSDLSQFELRVEER